MGPKSLTAAKAAFSSCAAVMVLAIASPAAAAPVLVTVNQDISSSPFTFSYMGGTFTFDGSGGFPNYLSVSTSGNAAVRTVFGQPSTDFTNRGTVVYDANTLGGYGSFPNRTSVPFTNGENFLGLRVTSGGQNYYGFAFTTNSIFNGFGFETSPNVGITATTNLAAVPEPTTWALLILGFGAIGATMRRRQTKFAFAA